MVKEEVKKIISELRILINNQNKFREHYLEFTNQPRCKKGCIEFIKSLTDDVHNDASPRIFHYELMDISITLLAAKSEFNSTRLRMLLGKSAVETHNAKELFKARQTLLETIGEHIKYVHEQLDKSSLRDAKERQTYLRRAVARLITVCQSHLLVPIQKDQWCEIPVSEYNDYLNTSLDELVSKLCYDDDSRPSIWYDWWNLDNDTTLASIDSYLEYLDTFLKY
ncbi:hypothetical protein [Aeromonas phage AerS_266]|nr:hypothetical protein [Aeromonas phage AerS_266]